MPKLSSLTLKRFLDRLASSEPAPGGGAAAALVIAQAAALSEMVARLNLKRLIIPGSRIARHAYFRESSLALMDEDAASFSALSKFKKEDRRGPRYDKALRRAAMAPFNLCVRAYDGIAAAEPEIQRTSRWLYSDLVEAAILYEAGFQTARLNVEINLSMMKAGPFKKQASSALYRMQKSISSARRKIEKGRP